MKKILIMASMMVLSMALTLKSGQVIGSDGQIYDGASPEKQEALIANAQNGGIWLACLALVSMWLSAIPLPMCLYLIYAVNRIIA